MSLYVVTPLSWQGRWSPSWIKWVQRAPNFNKHRCCHSLDAQCQVHLYMRINHHETIVTQWRIKKFIFAELSSENALGQLKISLYVDIELKPRYKAPTGQRSIMLVEQHICMGEFYWHKSRAHIFGLKAGIHLVLKKKTVMLALKTSAHFQKFSVLSQIFVFTLRFSARAHNFSLHGSKLRLQILLCSVMDQGVLWPGNRPNQ